MFKYWLLWGGGCSFDDIWIRCEGNCTDGHIRSYGKVNKSIFIERKSVVPIHSSMISRIAHFLDRSISRNAISVSYHRRLRFLLSERHSSTNTFWYSSRISLVFVQQEFLLDLWFLNFQENLRDPIFIRLFNISFDISRISYCISSRSSFYESSWDCFVDPSEVPIFPASWRYP